MPLQLLLLLHQILFFIFEQLEEFLFLIVQQRNILIQAVFERLVALHDELSIFEVVLF